MARTKLYAAIYVVLFVFATLQVGIESLGLLDPSIIWSPLYLIGVSGVLELPLYWWAFILIMVLSMIKAVFVAGYYQHLRWEPRSLTYLFLMGLSAAMALILAAGYSIT